MNNVEHKIKSLILAGEFLDTRKLLHEIDQEKLAKVLLDIGYDEESICAYSFTCFLMLEKETAEYHCLASEILIHAFPHLVGAYKTALFHIRRSIELCPEDIELEETLLFFNSIPEKLISDEEAKKIAQVVLLKKPTSEPAQRILSQ